MSMTDNAANTTKICVKCRVVRDICDFSKDAQKKDGLTPYCRRCRAIMSKQYYENNKEKCAEGNLKRYRQVCHMDEFKLNRHSVYLKRAYGITVEDYNNMFIEQGGRCGICGKHELESARRLVVDHCHETGRIRGLLCHTCNTGIGMFADSIQIMRNALKYLEIPKCQ